MLWKRASGPSHSVRWRAEARPDPLVDGLVVGGSEPRDRAVQTDQGPEGVPLAAIDPAQRAAIGLVQGLHDRLHHPGPVLTAHVFEAGEEDEAAQTAVRPEAGPGRGRGHARDYSDGRLTSAPEIV